MVYDYHGFPEYLYHITYNAPGSPELANHVQQLLQEKGIEASLDPERGYDHGGMSVSDAKRLKDLETENARLKKLLAESLLENEVTREALRKKW